MSETEVTTEVQFEDNDDLDTFESGFFGRKPEPANTTKAEVAQEQPQETEVEADAQNDDDLDEAELKEEIPDKPKRKTVQDRIDELVRQREELRRESQAELQKLRQEIEAYKSSLKTEPAAQANPEPKADAVDQNGNPVYALGEFDPQYIRDLTRYTLEQERAKWQAETAEAQRQAAITQEQQALQTSWNTKMAAYVEQNPDFVERGQALLNNFANLDQNYAGYLSQVLMSMEKGPDVLNYLSNHPEEAIAIVNSGAQRATLALGRIESRFLQSEQEAPKPKVTKAPPPPPVRARGTNGAFISVAPDTDDLEAFEQEFFKPRKYN